MGLRFEKLKIKESVRGSVEEALIEMFPSGVSVRRVEDISEALWGSMKSMNMKHLEEMEQETRVG